MDYASPIEPDRLFSHHVPTPQQIQAIEYLREQYTALGHAVLANTPQAPEQTRAIRALHDSLKEAVFAIVVQPYDARKAAGE